LVIGRFYEPRINPAHKAHSDIEKVGPGKARNAA
jgi:hypothetical protein